MALWKSKIGIAIGTFVVPFLATIAPIKVSSYVESKGVRGQQVLSFLMCFGGGVFFGTYLIHMAVEARDILYIALIEPRGWQYPLAEVIMGFGFFLVLFVDKIVGILIHRSTKKLANPPPNRKVELPENNGNNNHSFSEGPSTPSPTIEVERVQLNGRNVTLKNASTEYEETYKPSFTPDSLPRTPHEDAPQRPREHVPSVSFSTDAPQHVKLVPQHSHLNHENLLISSKSTRAIILMVGLSLHRIFEGMGMGLQHTVRHAWHLYAAIMCHEVVVGFSLGLRLVNNNWTIRRIFVVVAIISCVQPVGVTIGTLISELGEASNNVEIANGVLQSIATGTFIYVTFFEILGEEIHDAGLLNTFAVLLGFSAMALLEFIPEQSLVPPAEHVPCYNITI